MPAARVNHRATAVRSTSGSCDVAPLCLAEEDERSARLTRLDLFFLLGGYAPAGPQAAPRELTEQRSPPSSERPRAATEQVVSPDSRPLDPEVETGPCRRQHEEGAVG